MLTSLRARIALGFGVIMMLLIAATVVNRTLVSGISTDFDRFHSALDRKSQAVDIDLVMQKVRVRVNQWLRSLNPEFAKQADELLAQDVALLAQAATAAGTEKEKQTVADINRALQAYIESWRVIQGLYADESKIYTDRIIAPGAGIRADLAKLRDSDDLEPHTSRLIGEARDDFMASESLAFRYRTSMKQEEADQLNASISRLLATLDRASPAMKTSENSELMKRAITVVGAWRDAFGDASKVSQTKVARLGSWTAKEGEAMAVGANLLRTEGDANTAEAQSTIVSTISRAGSSQYMLSALIIVIGIVVSWGLTRSITRPISGLTAGMKELGAGNFAVTLPGLTRRDEVGEMARAVETFKGMAEQKARDDAEAKVKQDLIAARQRKADMHELAEQFEGAVGSIIETVSSASSELEASANTLTSTAEQAQRLTTMVAEASGEASANVRSVASATEEMTSSINEVSRQVQKSAQIASEAVVQAEKTNERIGELAQAANRIGDVVDLINTIAGQTNLLALNATIEAARAGDAGRGFAVVASEVKALADQTAKATDEISQQIAGMQTATNDSVNAIKEIGTTIGQMSEIASTIASAVEEQGAATLEISRNVQQAAQGTQQVSANISDVQHGATQTGSASSQVLSAAQSLSSESIRLKTELSRFLVTIRAA